MNSIVAHVTGRTGDLFRLVRLWPAAESCYRRANTIDGADACWTFRLGRVREHRVNWGGAETAYRKAIAADDSVAAYHAGLGRSLEKLGDTDGAERAFTAAIEHAPGDVRWLRARAKLRESLKQWQEAAEDYRAVVALSPERKDLLKLGQTLERTPDPLGAAAVYREALDRLGDDVAIRRKLAWTYRHEGNWSAACREYEKLVAAGSGDAETNYRYATCLEKMARMPFEFHGRASAATSHAADLDKGLSTYEAALARGPKQVTWLHRMAGRMARRKRLHAIASRTPMLAKKINTRVAQPERRLRRVYGLGRMYERHGRLERAAEKYRAGLSSLASVDAIWAHRAQSIWNFRLAYTEERLAPSSPSDAHLSRTVSPAGEPATAAVGPGGYFELTIADTGLEVEGFLAPGAADSVDILLDGTLVKSIAANTHEWLRSFLIDLSRRVVAEFPPRARLELRAGDRPLLTLGGHASAEVRVPDGTGRLPALLSSGYSVNKKGELTSPPERIAEHQMQYLKTYSAVKAGFAEILGKQPFLLYGTLLGCVRDGAFIPHDDDFDLSYLCDSADPVEVKHELQQDALKLMEAGYDVSMSITGRLFKVRVDDAWFDMNPMWFYRGRAWAFETHNLTRDDIEPVRSVEFLGHEVYVPANPEAFLEDNYGPTWRIPQKDFRYYRTELDRRVMRRSWLTPSDARAFARLAEERLGENPSAGRFTGISAPADAGFIT